MSTPNEPIHTLTPRQRFLRERQERQNLTFAIVSVAMIVIAALAALVFSGIVSIPFGNSFSAKVKYAEVGDIPCPTADSKPVAPLSGVGHGHQHDSASGPGLQGHGHAHNRRLPDGRTQER